MNQVIKELSAKNNLQDFLLTLLDDVQKYFSAAAPQSEEKTIAAMTTIFSKVQKQFPLIISIGSIAKRLAQDLKQKIAERTDKGIEKRKASGMKSFIINIGQAEKNEEELIRTSSEQNQQNLNAWVKKTLIETVAQLKDQIKEADELTAESLKNRLARNTYSGQKLPQILFVDSFLTNQQAVKGLQGYQIKRVVNEPKNKGQINFFEGAKALRGSRLLLLSADAILRNGGVVCTSGGMMLAVAARELGVPVLAISRSYCLWEHIMCNQQWLVSSSSGRKWFPQQDESSFRVCIGKQFDYVVPDLVAGLVGESQGWQNRSIVEIFEDYYN